MSKKKILYVITKSVLGGAQRYVFDLATSLPQDRFEAVVAAGRSEELSESRPKGAGGNGSLLDKLHAKGVRTITIPGLQRDVNIFKEILSLGNLLKIFIREKPDIIHLNSTKVGGLGAVAASSYKLLTFNFKLLTFFTVHGWGFNENRPLPIRALIFSLSWFSSLFQDKIILINTADFNTAQKFIPKRKLALILNGISPINFLPREEARKFLSDKIGQEIKPETILIGTIAELTKNKGLTYLMEALNRINLQPIPRPSSGWDPDPEGLGTTYKLQTIVIGEGEEREKLQNQIKILKLEDKVFLIGFIPEASRYLKGFDIFVLPSIKEGLPYTVLEALAAGLPVVATKVGGLLDLMETEKNGLLVQPQNPEVLGRAIEEVLNPALDPAFTCKGGVDHETLDHVARTDTAKVTTRQDRGAFKGGVNKNFVAETKFQLRDMLEKTVELYDK